MNGQSNGSGIVLRWAHLILVLVVQILLLGALYGTLHYQVEDHSRRLDLIEKRQEENFLRRDEFEKRHQDLEKRVDDLRAREQQLEMENLAIRQKR